MGFDKNKFPSLGTAELDKDKFKIFIEKEKTAAKIRDKNTWIANKWDSYFCSHRADGIYDAAICLYIWEGPLRFSVNDNAVNNILKMDDYLHSFNQTWVYHYTDEEITVISAGNILAGLPSNIVETKAFKNLSMLKSSELKALAGDTTGPALIASVDVSMNDLNKSISDVEQQIHNKKVELDTEKKKMEAEIQAMKEEIEAKYRDKMDMISKMKDELSEKVHELNRQVFLLETQLYGIRCFMGEVINFTQITSGKPAREEEPVILYQKLRYLDEEMAKYVSIYNFDGEDIHLFEDVLKYREDIRDLFAPGTKSISLVHISKDSVEYGMNEEVANVLKEYEIFHGRQIGILIRNGENVYMGWTDEDRISMQDNMFNTPGKTETSQVEDYTGSDTKETVASRYFIFQILQGVLYEKKMLCLPDGVSLYKKSPYVIFSMADGWITDNRFGDFSDIINETDQPLKKGDMVLTMISITRDDSYSSKAYDSWSNSRGRGDKNRTHDASIPNKQVLPINIIDRVDHYTVSCNVFKGKEEEPKILENGAKLLNSSITDELLSKKETTFSVTNYTYLNYPSFKGMTPEEILKMRQEKEHVWDGTQGYFGFNDIKYYVATGIRHSGTDYKYYLSAKKTDSNWDGRGQDSFANMEILQGEYLNLTYLNSVYIRYAIANRQANNVYVGGRTINFKSMLPYLQVALKYLDDREKKEAEMLSPYMDLYEDWQVDLSRWRMEHGYHSLTPTRAKKFAKQTSKPPV